MFDCLFRPRFKMIRISLRFLNGLFFVDISAPALSYRIEKAHRRTVTSDTLAWTVMLPKCH